MYTDTSSVFGRNLKPLFVDMNFVVRCMIIKFAIFFANDPISSIHCLQQLVLIREDGLREFVCRISIFPCYFMCHTMVSDKPRLSATSLKQEQLSKGISAKAASILSALYSGFLLLFALFKSIVKR